MNGLAAENPAVLAHMWRKHYKSGCLSRPLRLATPPNIDKRRHARDSFPDTRATSPRPRCAPRWLPLARPVNVAIDSMTVIRSSDMNAEPPFPLYPRRSIASPAVMSGRAHARLARDFVAEDCAMMARI